MADRFVPDGFVDGSARLAERSKQKLTPPAPSAERTERLRQLPAVRFDSTGRLNDNV